MLKKLGGRSQPHNLHSWQDSAPETGEKSAEKKKKHTKKKCEMCGKNHGGKSNKKGDAKEEKPEKGKSNAVAKVAQVDSNESGLIQLFKADKLASCKHMTHQWIVDSGASAAMSSHCNWFKTYQKLNPPQKVWCKIYYILLIINIYIYILFYYFFSR